ncbi:DUF2125 domain-containing protein [Maritalea mobilis]|uniref:DUF2125 domain-containing protein n=1 Tax=Maritalea mobilis TaxID=483324 RepID=UPI001C958108|nr:DUF2125 domain-containing protein [Maritalea mobilis]MBY6202955.1 DUF2125 domain-containing protein [Maritalea mobilis]
MSQIFRVSCSLSVLALCLSSPAFADVTAAELWAEWQATASASGQQISAEVTETETGLVLTNFVSTMTQEGVESSGRTDEITLTNTPDGTVQIGMPQAYTLTTRFPEYEGGPLVTLTFDLAHEGLAITASDEGDARVYDYAADTLIMALVDIQAEDEDDVPIIDMTITGTDLATVYRLSGDSAEAQTFTSEGTLGSLEGVLDVTPPRDIDGSLKISFTMGDMSTTGSGSVTALTMASQASTMEALPEGFDIAGAVEYGRFMLEFAFEDRGDSFDLFYSNAGGRLATALTTEEISYDIAVRDMETRIAGSEMPFPVAVSAASGELGLTAPLAASDTPEDAALRIAYDGVTVADSLWSIFDPAGQLPRDPATVILDATAQIRLLMDLLSPEAMESEVPPGELRALTVNELQVSLGGAELTGTGDLTFAEGQMMPMPVGSVDLNLSGGMTLLDRLVSAGLVPNEQAAMARGFAGMFTRPGATPDTLETTVEFAEGGGITANGIPLQ